MSSKIGKENRRNAAIERAKEYSSLNAEQKIKRLDDRLGKGIGAVKERKKLLNPGDKEINKINLEIMANKKKPAKQKEQKKSTPQQPQKKSDGKKKK